MIITELEEEWVLLSKPKYGVVGNIKKALYYLCFKEEHENIFLRQIV